VIQVGVVNPSSLLLGPIWIITKGRRAMDCSATVINLSKLFKLGDTLWIQRPVDVSSMLGLLWKAKSIAGCSFGDRNFSI